MDYDMKAAQARPYIMRARADMAAATRRRILDSARALLVTHSFEEMTIEAIAEEAGTTIRTVLRIFGSKEELFAQALDSLGELGHAPIIAGDLDALVEGICAFYEKVGDTVIRWLADEPRLPAMHEHLEAGRRHLRAWVAEAFASTLARLAGEPRKEMHDALIVAFDVHTWKLLRRDFRLPQRAVEARIKLLVGRLIGEERDG